MAKRTIRILHVVAGMRHGGTETWLMHVLRHRDPARFAFDFLVHTTQPAAYDEEIRASGSAIIPCPRPHQPWAYARDLQRILREHGPYDVVHSHNHHHSGHTLRLAAATGVPVRIAHSHTNMAVLRSAISPHRRLYEALMLRWIARYATIGLADSRASAVDLFGAAWEADARYRLLPCGIDLAPFRQRADRGALRAALGLPADAFVLGHVGRFEGVKNQAFLVPVFAATIAREPRARLLLVGDGPTRPAVERQVAEAGLADRVVFAGLRPDVPRLMMAAMDLFLLPSIYEGIPLVGTEAQAAGLPTIMADTVPDEGDVLPELIRRLPLDLPPSAWAEAVLATRSRDLVPQASALARVEQSPWNITASMRQLEEHYGEASRDHRLGSQGYARSA